MIVGRGVPCLMLALLLAGCPAGGGDGGGGNLEERLATACSNTTNMSQPLCDCVAEDAESELSPTSLRLLVAMLEEDSSTAASLRRDASIEDVTKAATFMVRAPAACARRGITSTEVP
jgi:hypothetical protein